MWATWYFGWAPYFLEVGATPYFSTNPDRAIFFKRLSGILRCLQPPEYRRRERDLHIKLNPFHCRPLRITSRFARRSSFACWQASRIAERAGRPGAILFILCPSYPPDEGLSLKGAGIVGVELYYKCG